MHRPRALIVGMGIGGLATALRLHDIGWEPLLVERAPERRSAGYFLALFGTGRAAAARLGVLETIGDRLDPASTVYDIDRANRRLPGLGFSDLPGAPSMVVRGDVETALYDAVRSSTELRFATTPVTIDDNADGVDVTLRTGDGEHAVEVSERFDLVVGADGLRSTVRRLAFGPDPDYLRSLNHIIGATVLGRPVPGFKHNDGLVLAEPGRAVWVFPFTDHQPAVLFSYRTEDEDSEFQRTPSESLRRAFGPEPSGTVLADLLNQFDTADEFLFDSTHQVDMPSWHTERVVLLGDAAWCPTLYSGMGASSALAGADLLGTSIQRNPGNLTRGLREWEQKLRPFIATHQKRGRKDLVMFVPQTRRDKVARTVTQALFGNPVGKRVMRQLSGWMFKANSIDIAAA